METVQAWLNKLDTEKLINVYLSENPISYEMYKNYLDLTVREIRENYKAALRLYIERLRHLTVKPDEYGKQGLLYVHRIMSDGHRERAYNLIYIEELLEKGNDADNYAYEFTEQATIMGFLVAETPLTQRYIYELIADVLSEASFFGFEQEYLEEEKEKLLEAEKEASERNDKGTTLEEFEAELEQEQGFTFDRESDDERALGHEVVVAELAYSNHSRKKELDLIRSMIT